MLDVMSDFCGQTCCLCVEETYLSSHYVWFLVIKQTQNTGNTNVKTGTPKTKTCNYSVCSDIYLPYLNPNLS